MGPNVNTTTQVQRPWRATLRTGFQALIGLVVITPGVLNAIANGDGASLGPWAAGAIAASAAVTRVMALPGVETWLAKYVSFLAADPTDSDNNGDSDRPYSTPL